LSTADPTWAGLGLNVGLHCEGHVTNHLSHGMASEVRFIVLIDVANCSHYDTEVKRRRIRRYLKIRG